MVNKKPNILFVVYAYAFFWLLLVGAVIIFSGNDKLFPPVVTIVQIVGPWAPTAALLVLFGKLYPQRTIREFYQDAFKEPLDLKLLAVFTGLYLLVVVATAASEAYLRGVAIASMFDLSAGSLIFGCVTTLFSGATGEESGWRGHLQRVLEKKHAVIKASLIVGVIWAFWHTPTWFATGLTGGDLVQYIFLDIIDKLSFALIIGICFNHCKNLIVPMWIHFIGNYFINPLQGSMVSLAFLARLVLLEVVVTAGYVIWYKKSGKKTAAAAFGG